MSQLSISKSVELAVPRTEQLFPLSKDALVMTWPTIAKFLRGRKGSFMDKWDEQSLFNELMANPDMFIWVGHNQVEIEGILLVSFSITPKEKLLWITGVYCDDIRRYLPLHKNVEQWAVMCGASSVLFEGSHAWTRLLRRYGYATPTAMLKKDLRSLWSH